MIKIKHNFDSSKFKWLWSKYVAEGNDKKHCTNCLKGKYSKKFSKHNENFNNENTIVFDEVEEGSYKAIYICGVINKGYYKKANYPHNVHLAIIPKEGYNDVYEFEGWKVEIENGFVDRIIDIEELPNEYKDLGDEYITCRIFRWMIGYFYKGMTRCGRCSSEMVWDDEWDSYFCKCGMGHSAMWEESFKNRLK